MKTIKIIISTIILLAVSFTSLAQSIQISSITISGLTLNKSYTTGQFIAIMGDPQEHQYSDDPFQTNSYKYNGNWFSINDGTFNNFTLSNSSYKINGIVGVGDNISSINKLNLFNTQSELDKSGGIIYTAYLTNYNDDVSPIYFYTKNGIITMISYLNMDAI